MPLNASRLIRRSTAALPLATAPPAFVIAAADLIHVVAMAAGNQRAVHMALDRNGASVSDAHTLPISLGSAGACGDAIIATGIHVEKGVRCALALDARGSLHWQTQLPIPVGGLAHVMPVCLAGDPAVVWEVEEEKSGELGIAAVSAGTLAAIATSSQMGIAYNLDVAAIGTSVFILRSRGAQKSAEVLRIERGTVTAHVQTIANAHAIAVLGDGVVVLGSTPQALLLQRLDATLTALGVAQTIATVEPPQWIRHATLHVADEERIAVSYLVGAAGELVQMPGGRSEPSADVNHFLARYDAMSGVLVDLTEVYPAGTAWIAGAWLAERFFFVHGTTGAALSIFELLPATPDGES